MSVGLLQPERPKARMLRYEVLIERAAERCAGISGTMFVTGAPRSQSHVTVGRGHLKQEYDQKF